MNSAVIDWFKGLEPKKEIWYSEAIKGIYRKWEAERIELLDEYTKALLTPNNNNSPQNKEE